MITTILIIKKANVLLSYWPELEYEVRIWETH